MTELTTPDQLRRIPDLAAERWATIGHPNPGEAVGRGSAQPWPSAPMDIEAWDILRTDDRGLLFRLAQCVRAVAETMRDEGRAWPELTNPPTWHSECEWLLATEDDWTADQWCHEYVTDEVASVHGILSASIREPRQLVLYCPDCGGKLNGFNSEGKEAESASEYRWFVCSDCSKSPSLDSGLRRIGQASTLTVRQWAVEFGVNHEALRKRINRAKLPPAAFDHRRRKLYARETIMMVAIE